MADSSKTKSPKRAGKRFGYLVAIAVNIALLVIANHILDWGWLPWLTEEFRRILPVMNVSFIASMVVNTIYLVYDPRGFKALAELGLLIISLIVTIRFWRVFPFDFSAYSFGWATLVRWLLGLALFGICVGMVVQVVQAARPTKSDAAAGPTGD